MPSIGPLEIAIVLAVVLIIFGPKRLPGLGRSLGGGIRELRGAVGGDASPASDQVASVVRKHSGEGSDEMRSRS